MKLSIAIVRENAPSSAFVVWRGFENSLIKASKYGYHGIELALESIKDVDADDLRVLLKKTGMEVSCISTGQVFSVSGLYFTHPDRGKRKELIQIFRGLMSLAKDFGGLINIGRCRGYYSREQSRDEVERLFIETARLLCDEALEMGVDLILEPVNRYETNFINNLDQGAYFIDRIDRKNIFLMPDLFHMNIEDAVMGEALLKYASLIKYIHFADSNRSAPGKGHIDFTDIFENLRKMDYRGWISVEILPGEDPDSSAREAAEKILPMMDKYGN